MRHLMRFVRFIARWLAELVIRIILVLLRLMLPFILRLIRLPFALMGFSITATVNNPRQFINKLASEWTQRLGEMGVSPEHWENAHRFCWLVIAFLFILGWLVTTLFLVAIVRIYFGYFT